MNEQCTIKLTHTTVRLALVNGVYINTERVQCHSDVTYMGEWTEAATNLGLLDAVCRMGSLDDGQTLELWKN